MSKMGLAVTLQALRQCRSGGIVHLAPPCSSWVFLSRGSTKRSKKKPRGEPRIRMVRVPSLDREPPAHLFN